MEMAEGRGEGGWMSDDDCGTALSLVALSLRLVSIGIARSRCWCR